MNWSERRVEGIGPVPAKIMFIGEAPGEHEDKLGIPFVGLAGQVLDGILAEVGIDRASIYITNIAKHRPKDNDFSAFDVGYLAQALEEVREEITRVRPNIIVLAGAIPLHYILDKKDITKYRGSVLESKYGKCIPIMHPAAIARDWKWRPITVCDIAKVKKEAEYPAIRREERNIVVMPSYEMVITALDGISKNKNKISFDIETETGQINCIALAISFQTAISIPFWFGASGSLWSSEQELEIWSKLKYILEDPSIPKIAQNAQYDMTILRDKYNIRVKGLWLDTMIAFHALYPELPKNLALMTSLYTDIPYYKYMIKSDDMTEFFRYNALDALATYECAEKIYAEMVEAGVDKFYYEHMHSLIEPIMAMNEKGVLLDDKLRKEAIKLLKWEVEELSKTLQDRVGHDININSPKQMQKWLYEELKLPVQYQKRKSGEGLTKTPSADEESLMALYSLTSNESLKIVIDIRERMKLVSTYLEKTYDKEEDGSHRARTTFNIAGTETGRLSSSETVYGTGGNLQNVPKGICRRMFIPDTGKVFVNADLSQAEARVVAYLAQDERLIKLFENGGDIHRRNAANIFGKPEGEVTEEQRELAKRITHASNYKIGPVTFAKESGLSVAESKRVLNQYYANYPRIKMWHMQVESQLRKSRSMTTPLGRKRTFFNRWSEQLTREGIAYVPQSTVVDIVNDALREMYGIFRNTETNILLQIHDAILLQTPIDDIVKTIEIVTRCMTRPVTINHRTLTIPCDISVGGNWNDMKKVA